MKPLILSACITLLAVNYLVACSPKPPLEEVHRGFGNRNIVSYDMKDGVRCYAYSGYGLSCVQLKAQQ